METVQHPRCFVYGLVDPETRLVFYVGQTTTGLKRPRQHQRRGWHYEIVVLDVVVAPAAPTASMCPWLPVDRNPTILNELERYWVAIGRAFGWPLRNRTDGGEGMRIDGAPETRTRMSASHVGKKHDAATRAKISAAIKARMAMPGTNVGNAGKQGADLSGARFGRLLVVSLSSTTPKRWNCRCDCGSCCIVPMRALRRRTSCGCIARDQRAERKARRAAILAALRMQPKPARARPQPRKRQAYCKHGHELTPNNVWTWKGFRTCKQCNRRNQLAGRARKRLLETP